MKRISFVLLLCTVLLILASCAFVDSIFNTQQTDTEVVVLPEPTQEPTPTQYPSPTPGLTPIKTTEPEPTPTPTPFSYYAPTTAMTFEELVGDNGIREEYPEPPPPDTYYVPSILNISLCLFMKKTRTAITRSL